jgi:uncharacterized membrane protein AbrB (regulator of aidB expression)
MNTKRAIASAILTYITTFVVGVLVGVIANVSPEQASSGEVPGAILYGGAVAAIILSALFAWWYFRPARTEANTKKGLYLGLIFIVVGFVLDVVAFAATGQLDTAQTYYSEPAFLTTLVLVVLSTTLVGWYLSRKGQNVPTA